MEAGGQFQVPTALTPRNENLLAIGYEADSVGIG
jgi:hypothetical protein